MSNVLAQAVASQKDAILYELFKAHGYTRTKVKKLVAKNRIDMLAQGNREAYHIDGKELFTIEKLVQQNDGKRTFTFTFREVETRY